ncbi:MAG: poly-gamma-glutamate biosynthesis protein PgsC [Christensenellales bacterium]|jgi:poly-gamma-glutamate biosynthesis protein PgsC/CapC
MYEISIILSVFASLLLYEATGILSGGVVTAGYLSFFINQPERILSTIILAVIIYFVSLFMTKYTIFYGRRRFHFVILLSAILTWLVNTYLVAFIALPRDIRAIGHIIPGLIANDMLRQGVMRTVLSLALSTAFVYLCRLLLGIV